jgi:hypothetical protein
MTGELGRQFIMYGGEKLEVVSDKEATFMGCKECYFATSYCPDVDCREVFFRKWEE